MASENRLMGFRIEADSPGNVEVTADKLWELLGDQTRRRLSGVIDRGTVVPFRPAESSW